MILALLFSALSISLSHYERMSEIVDKVSVVAYGVNMSEKLPLLVMVHGSPGDWKAMEKYMADSALQKKYRMIAITRPGYGESDSIKAYPDLQFQAKVVHAFVSKYANEQAVTILGHSVGGAVAMRYAIDFPNEAQKLILLAPTLSKRHEMPRIYNYVAKCKWVNNRISQQMRVSSFNCLNNLNRCLPFIRTYV